MRPRIAPDGRAVVYERQETDWKENAYVTQLFLADVASGRSVQLTRGKKPATGAEWSPDGRWIAFLTERDGVTAPKDAEAKDKDDGRGQAGFAADLAHRPRRRRSLAPDRARRAIEAFHWSKDGQSIAFTAPVPEAKALKDRKEKYGDYEVVESDFDQSQLWVVDVAAATRTGAPLRAVALTSDPRRSVGEFDWSPDSKRIAFAATPSPLLAYRSDCDVYLVERARPEAVKAIVALPGPDDAPTFSPDGSEIAFETALGETYHYYANGHIATVRLADVERRPARAAADVRDRTASFDEDAGLLAWGPDGIYMTALRRTDSHIFRIPAAGEVARVSSPDRLAVSAPSFTRDFKTAAFVTADDRHLPEIAVSALAPFQPAHAHQHDRADGGMDDRSRLARALEEHRRGRDRGRAAQARGFPGRQAVSAAGRDPRRADGDRRAPRSRRGNRYYPVERLARARARSS